jgi:hypothetical protein
VAAAALKKIYGVRETEVSIQKYYKKTNQPKELKG